MEVLHDILMTGITTYPYLALGTAMLVGFTVGMAIFKPQKKKD
jgi:hypothetical protein